MFCFFCLMTLKAKVQANWAPCTWITPTIALAIAVAAGMDTGGSRARRARMHAWLITVPGAALTLLLLCPWLRHAVGIRQQPEDDLANRTYGARQMASEVEQVRAAMLREGKPVFLAGNDYQTCALLAFYLPDHPQTFDLFLGYRLNFYAARIEELRDHLGENAVFVNETKGEDAALREVFERVEWTGPYPVWRRRYFAEPIRYHYYARCYKFRRFIGIEHAHGG